MGYQAEQFRPPDLRLLERLMEISGLPLVDLQFLARGGLLNTCLKHQLKEDYDAGTWNATLSILFGSEIGIWDRNEIAVWLDGYSGMVPAGANRGGIPHSAPAGTASTEQRL